MTDDIVKPAIGAAVVPSAIPGAQGESLASPSHSSSAVEDGIASSDPGFREGHSAFASFTHQQIRDYIQLADQKAAFLFAASAAMLAFLHGQRAASHWLTSWANWDWISAVSVLAMFGLSASIVLCAATVYPRTKGQPAGLLFWLAVAQRQSPQDYVRDVRRASDAALTEAYLTHTHELSKVCQGKYAALRWAFKADAIGFGGAVIYLLFAAAA